MIKCNFIVIKCFTFLELQVSSERYLKVTFGGNTYNLLDIPPESHTLVVEELENMRRLELDHLDEDFSLLVLFVEIAYFGAKFYYPYLQKYGRQCLMSVLTLCHEAKNTLNTFVENSEIAVDKLNKAYQYLKENKEEIALDRFIELPEMSNKMKAESQSLLEKCREQSEVIRNNLPQTQVNENIVHKVWYEIIKERNLYKKDKASIQILIKAVYLLDNILVRMRRVESHLKEIEGLFKSMGDNNLNSQVKKFTEKKLEECKEIWQTDAFKIDSLYFYVKWIALKKIFATAKNDVKSKIEEVEVYILESFSEDKAIEHIQANTKKFVERLRILGYDIDNM